MLFVDVNITDIKHRHSRCKFHGGLSAEPVTPEGNKQIAATEQKPFESLLKSEMKS